MKNILSVNPKASLNLLIGYPPLPTPSRNMEFTLLFFFYLKLHNLKRLVHSYLEYKFSYL